MSTMTDESPQGGWLLLTNDDGIEAPGFRMMAQALNKAGYSIIAFAPAENNSAAGMRINLMQPMVLRPRNDLKTEWGLDESKGQVKLFELDGTPCDTMIVALDGGIEHVAPGVIPRLVISGVNLGPNMSQDSYHSGTMGAAREAGLYGMPAIASSLGSFELDTRCVGEKLGRQAGGVPVMEFECCRSVPDPLARREVALAFDLDGAGPFVVGRPVSQIDHVCPPVGDDAA